MKVYIVEYNTHAGRWIYEGYQRAWDKLGHTTIIPSTNPSIAAEGVKKRALDGEECGWGCLYPTKQQEFEEDYIIMSVDGIIAKEHIKAIENSYKTFVFVQPNMFPEPWGPHANFISAAPDPMIDVFNQLDNVHLWTFANANPEYYYKWKKIHTVPLAFDNIGYLPEKNKKYTQYDISFIGGWVNNGFNEKRKIMMDIFSEFMRSGLKCGFFVGKNLSHQEECDVLANSKLTLNIHDAYQRLLGYDTNERTFKSLGLNGGLVSDTVEQLTQLFPEVKTSLEPAELVQITKEYLMLSEKELSDIKEQNKQNILDNHCYTHRVEQLLKLENE
tara:strand:+ start:200 stop:1189 length:990 start_codon:yes stop_codon:yes gene_type:complete